MSSTTILRELSVPNPKVDSSRTKPGPNSRNEKWEDGRDELVKWEDFSLYTMNRLYGHILRASWDNPPVFHPTEDVEDLRIGNEDCLDHVITKYLLPSVNQSLIFANTVQHAEYAELAGAFRHSPGNRAHIGRGGRAYNGDDGDIPDWAVVSPGINADGTLLPRNLIPGDTKLAIKFNDELAKINLSQYSLPLYQIQYYAKTVGSRYGFIITEDELVVFQFARPSTTGTAATEGGKAFDDTHTNFDLTSPRSATIRWSAEGDGVMTVRLALFFLCMLATEHDGANLGLDSYPPLHSWTRTGDSEFTHNTTGRIVTAQPPNGRVFEEHTATSRSSATSRSPSASGRSTRSTSATRRTPDSHQVAGGGQTGAAANVSVRTRAQEATHTAVADSIVVASGSGITISMPRSAPSTNHPARGQSSHAQPTQPGHARGGQHGHSGTNSHASATATATVTFTAAAAAPTTTTAQAATAPPSQGVPQPRRSARLEEAARQASAGRGPSAAKSGGSGGGSGGKDSKGGSRDKKK
ncbi:uncharacterized protein B0T15DRAFT_494387 [Chaetomium strumarium]|uniref:Uncharacterized protein n=1 Tax=Chaetomium strumarium TaxID=1170767 RepID=A0AAJ0GPR4_9PEZI|nr:hypothetical protein B0T15DRAFT_494387 [Chaetomium strumarium]